MSGINIGWAIAQLDGFIVATRVTYVPSPPNSIGFHRYTTAQSEVEIVKQAQIVEQILDRVVPGWRKLDVDANRKKWAVHHEASIRAKEALERADEVRTNLGDNAPEISASNLHPWIWSGAASLWQSGHYHSAVGDAAKKVNAETQNKVGRRDLSETKLFQEAFSDKTAEPGKPRLRRIPPDGSNTYRSVQRGAMALAEGIFAGIRNPLSHEADRELDEQVALEYLAALSVLARWVEESTVERTGDTV
ncbi:TIGR02391 family protein [Cryobacterium sp. TMT1-66-1]|uniref:TIGR02391 family protein n=1 Tax=Cryobacterium sp. TMT1-66-1 TaxID=1259242 RepID=UPI00106AB045|nr:TIGR02391 family protein [Cryobacterium sp. TMT1-66-1]TFD07540.1 restriction endonuclease [Cryobacterium sp. TMT1-66-1]